MRKLLWFFFLPVQVFATNFYVSNSGSDAAAGTIGAPWATIAKVNASMASFMPGDSVLFQRGGTFEGALTITRNSVVFGAYGSGNRPILTGFYTIPSWTAAGTNLWTATIPAGLNNVRLLTINGRITRVGRFPNYVDGFDAWIRYTNTLAASSPVNVSAGSSIPTSFIGGELVLFKNNWNLDVMPITGQSGNTFTCTNPAGLWGIAGTPYGGCGFFVQNSLAALDVQNEWHYNNTTKVVTMFSSANPSTLGTIKIPRLTTLVNLGSTTSTTLDNLDIQGCTEKAVVSTGGSNQTIKNCVIRYAQGWGIDMRASSALIQGNTIRDIGSNGVWFGNSGTFTGNTLKSIGAWEGLPGLTNAGTGVQGNQDDQYEGVLLQSSNGITCSLNEFDSVGYNAIKHYGSNITIEKNFIKFPCVTKSDGGGIYCWDNDGTLARTNRRIKNNVIVNSGKILYGTSTPGLNTQSYGIYFDGGSNGALCDSNVIAPANYSQNSSCSPVNTSDDAGFMLNGGTNLTLRGNIVFGWPDALEIWKPAICCVPSNNRIVGNAFYVNGGGTDLCTWNQSLQYHIVDNSTIAQIQTQVQNLGVIDSNFVSDFAPSPFTYKGQAANPGGPVKLAQWRTISGKDANTVSFPSTTPEFQYNATATPTTYTFTGRQKRDFRGTIYNNSATIPAYYGNIFFDNGPATTPVTLTVTATPTAIACNGGSSTVTVSASGGTAPYTGTGTFTRTAGTHTFSVTDAVANSGNATITITQPSALAVTASAGTISTPGGSTNVVISASGGTAPYTGTGTFSRTAGVHTFTVTDNNGCVSTAIVSLSNPVVVPAQSTILNNIRIINGN